MPPHNTMSERFAVKWHPIGKYSQTVYLIIRINPTVLWTPQRLVEENECADSVTESKEYNKFQTAQFHNSN